MTRPSLPAQQHVLNGTTANHGSHSNSLLTGNEQESVVIQSQELLYRICAGRSE